MDRNDLMILARLIARKQFGGAGSGNFGHGGRPGEVGGSSSEGGEYIAPKFGSRVNEEGETEEYLEPGPEELKESKRATVRANKVARESAGKSSDRVPQHVRKLTGDKFIPVAHESDNEEMTLYYKPSTKEWMQSNFRHPGYTRRTEKDIQESKVWRFIAEDKIQQAEDYRAKVNRDQQEAKGAIPPDSHHQERLKDEERGQGSKKANMKKGLMKTSAAPYLKAQMKQKRLEAKRLKQSQDRGN